MSVLVSPAAGFARATDQQDEAQLDGCRPALCSVGTQPHARCVCGFPMPVHAALCNLCRLEGLEPQRLRKVESALEWDGRRYPSCRQSRRSDPHPDSYRRLLTTILAPAQGKEAGA